ncbi:hypothetical protein EKN06_00605 [Croceicoccus ponticola]|uniref:Uncharacterized protein n=2 Tax=Croceicoccus ponticola TaxID=2217664 RepID=A0A437GZK6_9SPHN|nr:hypothetical protein EKN06_00605 [Croceicoccus ponticola]
MAVIDDPNIDDPVTRITFARWLCKIFIGILVKETTLDFDRKDRAQGKIVDHFFLEDFFHAQLILQTARKKSVFQCLHGSFPCSVYMYRISPDETYGQFDLSTSIAGHSIAMRIGPIGVIFVNDGGLQLHVDMKGPLGLDGRDLHPVQFSEIAARVHYKAGLRDATHTYTSWETPDLLTVEQVAVRPYTDILVEGGARRIFRPWDDIECAEAISRYRIADWGPVYDPATGMFTTTLGNGSGEVLSLSTLLIQP